MAVPHTCWHDKEFKVTAYLINLLYSYTYTHQKKKGFFVFFLPNFEPLDYFFFSVFNLNSACHTSGAGIAFCLLSFICPTLVGYFQLLHRLWHVKPTLVHTVTEITLFIILISLPHLFSSFPQTHSSASSWIS